MNYKRYPILVIDPDVDKKTLGEKALHLILDELDRMDFSVISSSNASDGLQLFLQHADVSCIIFEWDTQGSTPHKIIQTIREKNHLVPIFIMSEKQNLKNIPSDLLSLTDGYFWKMEDTPRFIAGRIDKAAEDYLNRLLPPFFKELIKYVETYKYSWHTPGHSGGAAFLKSPVGKIFHNFFGENVFRADLSVSVPELGSLLEHSKVNGKAEQHASLVFGSDYTFFVTNGTSTANKIVANACVADADIVLVDRNCHKSLQHALTLTAAIPVYLIPSRNAYGIIGGIPKREFDQASLQQKIDSHPLIEDKKAPIKLAIITNSTYDGLIYDVVEIKKKLKDVVSAIHFDEAWYAYAHFHPIYQNRYAMSSTHDEDCPLLYATQSSHKVLAAFSQASMIHIKNGKEKMQPSLFNEAFMMHTSTSPQYNIIASLDVATQMMEGVFGQALIQEAIEEAIAFREKMTQIAKELMAKNEKNWWFSLWQPEKISDKAKSWILGQDSWHGYQNIDDHFMMLDPIKVTILTPGINSQGGFSEKGLPAFIVSRYLMQHGIVDEKTGFYSFLALFTMGITKGKSSILISTLFNFKKDYDANKKLIEIFPDLVEQYPEKYEERSIQELAEAMHQKIKEADIISLTHHIFETLPKPVMTPHEAYQRLIQKKYEEVPVKDALNRIMAVMLVPYPPGIPVIMPGEKITRHNQVILDYFLFLEDFDKTFPGFETETHGIDIKSGQYFTKVLLEETDRS